MNFAIAAIAANLASIVCVAVSGTLAFHGREGWGWFLFGAVVLSAAVSSKGDA